MQTNREKASVYAELEKAIRIKVVGGYACWIPFQVTCRNENVERAENIDRDSGNL